jgi:flagellar L-ring protein precursor FlgH
MMRFMTALLLVCAASGLHADSIWPQGYRTQGNNASLVSDQRALEVGDLVTVQVSENASASQAVNTQTQKQASVAGNAGLGSWTSAPGSQMPISSYGAGAVESSQGGGNSSRSGNLVTTLSARVVSVLPNGNLYIEGRRVIKINDDKQNIFLSGIIRPRDVGPNNTISSSVISDAQIRYEGKGPLAEKSTPGIFTRVLDWIGIF